MKKRFYLLGMLAAGLTFAGCTDDIDDASGNGGNATVGDGYVKVAINLPTTSGNSTRSKNDQFDDGLESEYAVKDAIIAFFKGNIDSDTEGDATFVTAKSMSLTGGTEVDNNVTIKYSYTIDGVPTVEANEQMYAFVILNNNGLFSVNNGSLSYGDEAISSFGDLQGKSYTMSTETNASKFITTGFLMSNAPISDRPSVTSAFIPKVTTLAKVTVYENDPSSSDAIKAEPIYVERAVAKVEVNVTGDGANNNNDGSITLPVKVDGDQSQNYDNHKVRFTRWALNVTNKSSKIVRDVSDYATWAGYFNDQVSHENRFFGTTANPYRVYWAVDNNYSEGQNSKVAFNHFDGKPLGDKLMKPNWHNMANEVSGVWKTDVDYDYCFENTMEAKQQIQGFTTGVLLEGKYQIGDNADVDVFTLGASTAVYSKEEMLAYINEVLGKTADKYVFVAPEDGIVIGSGDDESAKIASYQNVFQTESGSPMSENDAKELIANATVGTINYYQGGRTYYWSRPIKHFGDHYTPIYKGDTQVDYFDSANDYTENDHLGRYGVVRNNWYELNITSVSGPGYPEIPEIPTEPENPDDSGKGYVKMEINILSWAKREQNVDL